MNYKNKLDKLADDGKDISVGIIGTGFMGGALASQLVSIKGVNPRVLINRTVDKAKNILINNGIPDDMIGFDLNSNKDFLVSDDINLAFTDKVDIVVDATGHPEQGARIASLALEKEKDLISFNIEADSAIGVHLAREAKIKGLIYSGISGDEPGAIKELYDFASLLGFEVLAVGKGKNNPLNKFIAPADVKNLSDGLMADKYVSFVDGTNTMIELCAVGNAIGFTPDVTGCHGVTSSIEDLPSILSLKSEGGVLNSYGALEYVFGIAPGVFALVRSDNKEVDHQMKFLKMGKGPNYALYRPFHLTGVEALVSICRAYFHREETIAPVEQTNEVAAIAKKDMAKGECFDTIGGSTFFGTLEKKEDFDKADHIPVALINEKAFAKEDIKKGEYLTSANTEIDTSSEIYKIKNEEVK
ncbi:MAG: NAD(P)-dependent oxidoreductase [Tissierellia bacterium]|nr:NAD(P)-dependent oxidoreductase [Tissierellia bacterium]